MGFVLIVLTFLSSGQMMLAKEEFDDIATCWARGAAAATEIKEAPGVNLVRFKCFEATGREVSAVPHLS